MRMAIGAAVAMSSIAVAAAPAAVADVEPNGAVFTAEGPLVGGQEIQGTVGPADQDDWYVVHVEGVHQLHLTGAQVPPSGQSQSFPACASVELTNANGSAIPPDFTSGPGSSTFYVHAFERDSHFCPPETAYSFRLDPAEAFVVGPGKLPIKGTAEPNDSRSTAGGPLAPGAWYHSELETVNDQDWLRLYVRPGKRVDVQAVVYGPPCFSHEVTLRNARGVEMASYTGTRETIGHLVARSRNGARLYVRIVNGSTFALEAQSCVHSATVIQVAPAGAVMSAAEVKEACADGRAAVRRHGRRVAADKRAIARAKGRGNPTAGLRRELRRDRVALKRSNARVSAYCSR